MVPAYDLDKVKCATDAGTFERAVGLYEKRKVTKFQEMRDGFSATVLGSMPYEVFVSARHYDRGTCTCYLGQEDVLCKHMVAVAIQAVTGDNPLNEDDRWHTDRPVCSGRRAMVSAKELAATKKSITAAMRSIKPYDGPSRIWFAYQDSLQEGCRRLSALISGLPVSEQTARVLVGTLLRLDKKLSSGGVDDSDGTVGGFMEETVRVLKEYASLDSMCVRAFQELEGKETCFGWEESLVILLKEKNCL